MALKNVEARLAPRKAPYVVEIELLRVHLASNVT